MKVFPINFDTKTFPQAAATATNGDEKRKNNKARRGSEKNMRARAKKGMTTDALNSCSLV
jgi:hypothetical protein